MSNELIIVSAIVVLAVGLFVLARVRKRPLPRCPECHAKAVIEIKREPKATRHFVVPGAQHGGDTTQIQQEFDISYRCNQCQHQFSRLVTETEV